MRYLMLLSTLFLTACSSLSQHSVSEQQLANRSSLNAFNSVPYQQWQRAGDKVLWVNTQHSFIVVSVFKEGALARLGHDHVVVVHDLAGAINETKGVGDFGFSLKKMAVDEDVYRARMHLPLGISQLAIEGTRNNMLNKVLFADQYPYVKIHVQTLTGQKGYVGLLITLHGVTRRKIISYHIRQDSHHTFITGQTTLSQTQFGIKPFAVLGGALQVKNEINIQFNLETQEQKLN
ncbi:MAG: hypothetical protein B7Z60_06130 [Ferrovum sp. 37-45-19]|jgi:hypothetical protein|uniref:YceI family protein n=1 Tax=Ferrovum sp. JA12 TaxID=1356299 RepID=UPI0007025D0F|nr:YceI family protein [Ferrovum sp. JA12]OYV79290.1 MAG: hypothetical protein B7Z65_06720 [Ferrovum sp. 21-44-67]OYV94156.1 MAG: hypothetical protein B7Z60_06130 [Ferrovum sp. 37-45-19]OZB34331.1 MAG: hypothetical protein B7X47_01165 [Ferrovum sp. 34-44-207]HQT81424.1 YceI family protein [Ferrovaceae bacterium]KRH78486.1 YceI-like domain protein [Ferrovum sp. JA12]